MKSSKTYSLNDVISFLLRGFTIYRALVYAVLKRILPKLSGSVLDIAAGNNPLYHQFLSQEVSLMKGDIREYSEQNQFIDMNKKLPFQDSSIDNVLCVNALYIAKDPSTFIKECYRVLRPGGKFILVSPFISNEMRDPDDFRRLTSQGLESILKENGFCNVGFNFLGERFTSALYILNPFFLFRIIRFPFAVLALILDRCIPQSITKKYPAPMGYIFWAEVENTENNV